MMERRRPRNVPSRPLVLVADDYPDTRDMYVTTLAAFGFEAVPVSQCADTFRRAWERHPDAIVADLPLLDAGGWQLIQHLKTGCADPRHPDRVAERPCRSLGARTGGARGMRRVLRQAVPARRTCRDSSARRRDELGRLARITARRGSRRSSLCYPC